METAYVLTCYMAFFVTLDRLLLPKVKKVLGIPSDQLLEVSEDVKDEMMQEAQSATNGEDYEIESYPADMGLILPHPTQELEDLEELACSLYDRLTECIPAFLETLVGWDDLNEKQKKEILSLVSKLPREACKEFRGLYLALATKFEEFFIWTRLYEDTIAQKKLSVLSKAWRTHIEQIASVAKEIDVGLKGVSSEISLMPSRIVETRIGRVLEEIRGLYSNEIREPIANDSDDSDNLGADLTYPAKEEIFVPQAYKAICYSGKERLEDEKNWDDEIPKRSDLGTFVLSCLSSPHSATCPIIVLGHPGSGKSLLTDMLASRLYSQGYTAIKVALRDINAETEISSQVEDYVGRLLSREISWADMSDHSGENPLVVFLDGYDELLQASGRVFSAYLRKVQKFMQNELQLGRKPVRVVVTSRVTLIDKAEIPKGSVVIRLLEFDKSRQEQWIQVWNRVNADYFAQEEAADPFELPEDKPQVMNLAQQPLLLQMLALYDSESNELRKRAKLEQTALYDQLLRRFIHRQKSKYREYSDLEKRARDKEIDLEMDRLGVAAIGMFNRRTLKISASQLDVDLKAFGLSANGSSTDARAMSQGDLLLGSFFFIYESRAKRGAEEAESDKGDAAFEFLHNTFGEFLTADFILKRVIGEAYRMHRLRADDYLRSRLSEELAKEGALPQDWYDCLCHTPLFTRPVILEMMQEWSKLLLRKQKLSQSAFTTEMEAIVNSEIQRCLRGDSFPSFPSSAEAHGVPQQPAIGYLAIYTMNLVILRSVLIADAFSFKEDDYQTFLDGVRPWDQLTHHWRSWFSIESLNGLAHVILAERDGSTVIVHSRGGFDSDGKPSQRKIDRVVRVARSLADDVISGFVGLLSHDLYSRNVLDLNAIERLSQFADLQIGTMLLAKRLRICRYGLEQGSEPSRLLLEVRSMLTSHQHLPSESTLVLSEEYLRTEHALGPVCEEDTRRRRALKRPDWILGRGIGLLAFGFNSWRGVWPRTSADWGTCVKLAENLLGKRLIGRGSVEWQSAVLGLIADFGDEETLADVGYSMFRHRSKRSGPSLPPVAAIRVAEALRRISPSKKRVSAFTRWFVANLNGSKIELMTPGLVVRAAHLALDARDNETAHSCYSSIADKLPSLIPINLPSALIVAELALRLRDDKSARAIHRQFVRPYLDGLGSALPIDMALRSARVATSVGDQRTANRLTRIYEPILETPIARFLDKRLLSTEVLVRRAAQPTLEGLEE